MAKFWLCAAVGFYMLQLCLAEIGLNISCRYMGVFHVEKNRRYSLTREDAVELCKALNSTIPTWDQMESAYNLGFETCRYGYIEDKIVVPRHHPYSLCAANNTGIYILTSNVSDRYDTYCFNSSETRERVCDPIVKLYSAWPDDQSVIDITNADGSRYIGGEKYTEAPPLVTDDDNTVGSGSANDRGTTDSNVVNSPDGSSQDTPIAFYPHPTDDAVSTNPHDGDSAHGSWTPNDHSGQDGSKGHDSKTTKGGKQGGHDQDGDQSDTRLSGESPKSQPRAAHIPDWLIVVASLVALALILGVCIAVNSRRRCGQKQKVVINNGKGAIEDKNMGGLNGEASKSQEMVHLVSKEKPEDKTGPRDEFLSIDETQNQQDMDLKTGL